MFISSLLPFSLHNFFIPPFSSHLFIPPLSFLYFLYALFFPNPSNLVFSMFFFQLFLPLFSFIYHRLNPPCNLDFSSFIVFHCPLPHPSSFLPLSILFSIFILFLLNPHLSLFLQVLFFLYPSFTFSFLAFAFPPSLPCNLVFSSFILFHLFLPLFSLSIIFTFLCNLVYFLFILFALLLLSFLYAPLFPLHILH